MDATTQYRSIARSLSPSAKIKVQQVAPRFLVQSQSLREPKALHLAAINTLRPAFPTASGQQLDVLAFYLIATVAGTGSDVGSLRASREPVQSKMNTVKDLNEVTQRRLELLTDNRTKLHQTLSNMLKKMSDTQQSIVQNLK